MRLLLKFLSLDIVPFMVMKYPGDFMGNGRVLLSGGLAPSKEFGVIMWDVRRPFFFVAVALFCFVFQTQLSNQMRDSRVEPWGGAIGQKKSGLNLRLRGMSNHYGI